MKGFDPLQMLTSVLCLYVFRIYPARLLTTLHVCFGTMLIETGEQRVALKYVISVECNANVTTPPTLQFLWLVSHTCLKNYFKI